MGQFQLSLKNILMLPVEKKNFILSYRYILYIFFFIIKFLKDQNLKCWHLTPQSFEKKLSTFFHFKCIVGIFYITLF